MSGCRPSGPRSPYTVRGTKQEIEKRVETYSMLVVGRNLGRRHSRGRLYWVRLLRSRNHSRRLASKLDLENEKWMTCRLAERMAGGVAMAEMMC